MQKRCIVWRHRERKENAMYQVEAGRIAIAMHKVEAEEWPKATPGHLRVPFEVEGIEKKER